MKDDSTHGLIEFLRNSPTAFHAVQTLAAELEKAGYTSLDESSPWVLQPGQRHYVTRNDSALLAFTVGSGRPWETGFRLMGAHTDSPCLRVKPQGEFEEAGQTGLRIEVYGGAIQSTWLDRDLAMAGRIIVRENGRLAVRFLDTRRPICIVPNLAIHLNREVNKGVEYNAHEELAPLFSGLTTGHELADFLARELGCSASDVVDADLFLYEFAGPQLTGAHGEFLTSGRLDNLAMCHAIARAMTAPQSGAEAHTRVGLYFDNEETGSNTFQGADSSFARDVLERIVLARGGGRQELFQASARSLLVSADMAHACHPNWSRKHDKKYAPTLNGGPVIKQNGNQKYGTTSATAAIFESLCQEAAVPVQRMINRADVTCGSTIGAMSAAGLSIPTVDIGNPLLAMHSIRETVGVADHEHMCRVLRLFATTPKLPALS